MHGSAQLLCVMSEQEQTEFVQATPGVRHVLTLAALCDTGHWLLRLV